MEAMIEVQVPCGCIFWYNPYIIDTLTAVAITILIYRLCQGK